MGVGQDKLQLFLDSVKDFPDNYPNSIKKIVKKFYLLQEREDLFFDLKKFEKFISIFEYLKQGKGAFLNINFSLEPWQVFYLGMLLFFKHKDTGLRFFRDSLLFLPKKHGKSALIGGLSVVMLLIDKEPNAETLLIANSLYQSNIIFSQIKNIINKTPGLKSHVKLYDSSVLNPKNQSIINPVSTEVKTADGFLPNILIFDEIKDYSNSDLKDTHYSGLTGRKEPLCIEMTTAGLTTDNFGFKEVERAKKILNGEIDEETFLPFMWFLDDSEMKGDAWKNETTWKKVNPMFGISKSLETTRKEYKSALQSSRMMINFKAKHLNIFPESTQSEKSWLNPEIITKNFKYHIDEKELEKEDCYLALDLSTRHDFTTYCLYFPSKRYFLYRVYTPSNGLSKKNEFENNNYFDWVDKGYLRICEGNTINYTQVKDDILDDLLKFNCQVLGYDDWKSKTIIPEIENKIKCIPISQKMKEMSEMSSSFENYILDEKLNFGKNPIAKWCLDNTAIYTDKTNNIKPVKISEAKRIDLTIVSIMALGLSKESELETTAREKKVNSAKVFFI